MCNMCGVCTCVHVHAIIHMWLLHSFIVLTYSILLLYRFQLKKLKSCKDDVKQIAECFIRIWQEAEGSKIYSDYCTKYPKLVFSSILSRL